MSEPKTNDLEHARWIRATLATHEGRLVRYAARILGDVERARDVVQEVFLRLLRADRAGVEPILAEWLFTVCRNLALDVRGKENRMRLLEDQQVQGEPGLAPEPSAALERAEARTAVLALVGRLPEHQQEVVRLKFQEGLSYKEISRITTHSVSYVGVLLHEALKTIRIRIPSSSDLAPHV